VAMCERNLSERLNSEASSSGVLSIKKEAVRAVRDDMYDFIQRTLRLARWRTNSRGGPNPIRMATANHFVWSVDGSDWKNVADSIFVKVTWSSPDPTWSKEDAEFIQTEIMKGTREPLGHELLREADVNRHSNPRSSLILAVAAAEVGFKQFVSRTLPDTAWLLDLPLPPLTEMLKRFPWVQLKARINGKVPAVPDLTIDELKKAIHLRNKIVHSGVPHLSSDTMDSVLDTVRDFLYFLDMLDGSRRHTWPWSFIRSTTISHFTKG
jgi:hypothetical protein